MWQPYRIGVNCYKSERGQGHGTLARGTRRFTVMQFTLPTAYIMLHSFAALLLFIDSLPLFDIMMYSKSIVEYKHLVANGYRIADKNFSQGKPSENKRMFMLIIFTFVLIG